MKEDSTYGIDLRLRLGAPSQFAHTSLFDISLPLFLLFSPISSCLSRFPIDCITHRNGSEPHYKAERARLGGEKAIGGDRDRDNNDLLFSLRALETNMPWHQGEIIILSPSPPSWLNTKNKR